MALWMLIAAVLMVQEYASTAYVLILAHENNFPSLPIHAIWICAALFDMYVGFTSGKWLKKKSQGTEFGGKVDKFVDSLRGGLEKTFGGHGDKVFIALLGMINFSYLNAFIAAWLGFRMRMAILLSLIGNFMWYLFVWAAVLGITNFISDPNIILLIIVVVGILSHLLLNYRRRTRS